MPTEVAEHIVLRPVLTKPIVKSVWAQSSPIMQRFSFAAWADAATMPLAEGVMMVKNDHNFLYLLLDLTKDTGNSPGVGDYFWLSFDVDGNAAITPHRDANYGIYPELPIRIGRQLYLGPGVWTGLQNQPTQSLARHEFLPSPHSKTPHRIWELRIELKEVMAHPLHAKLPPLLRFGLRVSSTSPAFTSDTPRDFYKDFRDLPGILLEMTPSFPSIGKPVAGIGLIPVGTGDPHTDGINPTTGRATTASNYYLPTKDAAFGGVLNFMGDKKVLETLWNQNVRKYCLKFKGTQHLLLESWTNYHFKNNQWVYQYISPDGDGFYNLINPAETYSIDHLLFQWNTIGIPTGTHDVEIDFVSQTGTVVDTQTLRLMIDNNQPQVQIDEITYKNKGVQACEIVTIDPGTDPVKVQYTAFDTEGDVYCYGLDAYHGEGKHDVLVPQTFPTDGHGVTDVWLSAPVNPKFPSETCAYEFRLWAYPKVVNGYSYLGYTEATEHVTFLCPQAPPYKILATKKAFPHGIKSADGRTGKINK